VLKEEKRKMLLELRGPQHKMNNLNNNINIQDGKFNHLSLAYKLNRFIVSYLKLFDDSLFTYNY